MSNNLEALSIVINDLKKEKDQYRKKIRELEITILTLENRLDNKQLPSKNNQNIGTKPSHRTISVSKELRQFLPTFLKENYPTKFQSNEIADAVNQKGIGSDLRAPTALMSKVLTDLVKSGTVIKTKENKRIRYYAAPEPIQSQEHS
jgi:hypothetical protein